MRIDKALLFRLDRVQWRRHGPDIRITSAAVIRPIAAAGAVGNARLGLPIGIVFLQGSGVRQLRHAVGRDLGKGELHRADASLCPLAGGEQLRDVGEAAPAALDFVGCRPISEAKRLRDLRCRTQAIAPAAGGVGGGIHQPHRAERHRVIVAGEPGGTTRDQAVGVGKRDGQRPLLMV